MPKNILRSFHMNKGLKLVLLPVCGGVLCLGFALVVIASRQTPTYSADSMVMMQSFTNAVLGRPFETQVIKSIPAVHRLTVTTWSAGPPGHAMLEITALGSSPQVAQSAANDAAKQLCIFVMEHYGKTSIIIMQANSASRWQPLWEMNLQVTRLFKR